MNVSEAIWQRLAQEIDTVFYLPGGMCGPLVDALGQSGLQAVCCLHEQGAGFAALAYAQYRGLGVALVTSGPGSTNIMTPCLAAWTDSAPLIVISGQTPSYLLALPGMRTRGTQEAPTVEMVRPITKMAEQPQAPASAVLVSLDQLIRVAKEGRAGPVWLDLCLDTQGKEIE